MHHEAIGPAESLRTEGESCQEKLGKTGKSLAIEAFVWGGVAALLVGAHFAFRDASSRIDLLRVILVLAAAGEGLGAISGIFRPRWFAERNGRLYAPAYHGVSQDFGFYNFAFALLFSVSAFAPTRSTTVIAVAALLYGIHGSTHLLRYFEVYYGGGTSIPTRPQVFELRDGLQLLAGAIGMALFFPQE